MLKGPISAEITAVNPANRRWITVSPLDNDPRGGFRLWQYEVPAWAVGYEFDPHYEEICVNEFAADEVELLSMLQEKSIDPLSFDAPWNVAHPRFC